MYYIYYINYTFFTKKFKNVILMLFIYMIFITLNSYYKYNTNFIALTNLFFKSFLYNLILLISDIDYNIIIIYSLFFLLTIYYKSINTLKVSILYIFFIIELPYVLQYNDLYIYNKIININLINGLFIIHPIILLSLLSLLFWTSLKYFKLVQNIFNINFNYNYYNKTLVFYNILFFKNKLNIILLILTSLVLFTGSWWAQQELNWGGYWVWDFIELVNLFLLSFYIYNKHIIHRCKYVYNFILQIICIFIILTIYIYSRYNLIPSVHTFLSDLCFLQYDFFIKLIIKLVFFYVIYY
jgi:hypothetical protein